MMNALIADSRKHFVFTTFYRLFIMAKNSPRTITLVVDPKMISDISVNMAIIATKMDQVRQDVAEVKDLYATKQEVENVKTEFSPTRTWVDRILTIIVSAVIATAMGLILVDKIAG